MSGDSCGKEQFLVLDGGLATELTRAGFNLDGDPLWSARVLVENPQAVKSVHKSFLESGANIVITATYQVSLDGLLQHCGLDESKALDVIHKGVKIAQEACHEVYSSNAECQRKMLVAGSVGPYGACQHDGSEYTGKYVDNMTTQELMNWHRPRVEALIKDGVDILALETIPAQKEAEALIELLKEFPTAKAWLSLSCKDGTHTCHGEPFSDVVSKIASQSKQIVAVGVNCTAPWFVTSLLQGIKGKVDLPFVVYPNSGEEWRVGTFKWADEIELEPRTATYNSNISSYVLEWIEVGARWIGGCCLMQPKHIESIREVVDKLA
ncbi:homocysteine S-methyltransferase YbgG-like isoform X1 [Oculina patagonica]